MLSAESLYLIGWFNGKHYFIPCSISNYDDFTKIDGPIGMVPTDHPMIEGRKLGSAPVRAVGPGRAGHLIESGAS